MIVGTRRLDRVRTLNCSDTTLHHGLGELHIRWTGGENTEVTLTDEFDDKGET